MTTSAFAEALQLIRGLPSISSHPPLLTLYYYIVWFLFNVCGWILVILHALLSVFCFKKILYLLSCGSFTSSCTMASPTTISLQEVNFLQIWNHQLCSKTGRHWRAHHLNIPLFPFKKIKYEQSNCSEQSR